MICSDDGLLAARIEEYSKYLVLSGWKWEVAHSRLIRGSSKDRPTLLNQPRVKQRKKLAWVTTYYPRVPSKGKIISNNMGILYANPKNKDIFPRELLIAAERRRKNLGEIYKPTVPRRFPRSDSLEEPGFFPCGGRCDTCRHARPTKSVRSTFDGRTIVIKKHLTCKTPWVVYVITCMIHGVMYVGSAKNLKLRWANHKSDINCKKVSKCRLAAHVCQSDHPKDASLPFLEVVAVDAASSEEELLKKEISYQCNLGTLFSGLNARKDFHSMSRGKRIIFNK